VPRHRPVTDPGFRRRMGRVLLAAVDPRTGSDLAAVRRLELEWSRGGWAPLVVSVVSTGPEVGASTISALLAQRLAGRQGRDLTAVLDADRDQALRRLLGSGSHGGLGQLLADPVAGHQRRRVDSYVDGGGLVPLLAPAVDAPGPELGVADLAASLAALRRRYPNVVVDLSARLQFDQVSWALANSDHVVLVAPLGTTAASDALRLAAEWTRSRGADAVRVSVVVSLVGQPELLARNIQSSGGSPFGVVVWPVDQWLAHAGVVRLGRLSLPTRRAVEQLAAGLAPAGRTVP
jgi:MinD-like ATPase involved in chromosome partitioning or flagellar assembly